MLCLSWLLAIPRTVLSELSPLGLFGGQLTVMNRDVLYKIMVGVRLRKFDKLGQMWYLTLGQYICSCAFEVFLEVFLTTLKINLSYHPRNLIYKRFYSKSSQVNFTTQFSLCFFWCAIETQDNRDTKIPNFLIKCIGCIFPACLLFNWKLEKLGECHKKIMLEWKFC